MVGQINFDPPDKGITLRHLPRYDEVLIITRVAISSITPVPRGLVDPFQRLPQTGNKK